MKTIKTHTGKIFVDTDRKLEFLVVGDYGKENNIKADFLGLTKVKHSDVDLSKKFVATISTQKGCPMKCKFCDCPSFGFYGNASLDDLIYETETILQTTGVNTKRFNLHFARMGEPTFNPDVFKFTIDHLVPLVNEYIIADTIHPVVSTMLPRSNRNLLDFLLKWCDIKNNIYHGEAGLQFSINSTSDLQREYQMGNKSLLLSDVAKIADVLPMPVGRKYTLNFAVTANTTLDAKRLNTLFDKDKWIVKITPIHETHAAIDNDFYIGDTYTDYRKFEQPLLDLGWDVIVFVPSKEEDSDRIACGNALISERDKYGV